mgnify:CR=1 FL=1
MAAESLARSSAINLINGSIDSFMFSHACYCTSNMESLSEDDIELYDQMHEVISILNDDEDYRHDLETMPLEDLKEFLLMCRKMADNNNLSLKSEFPQGNFEIVEDEKTETELNPDKIENEKSFWNTLWGALQGEYNENPTGTEILIDMGLNFIPFVGQACDVRDITACLKKLVIEKRVNEIMIWVTLLLTAIGCVPYAGDVVKAGCKAIIKGADDIVLKILRKLDADDVQKAFKILRSKFTTSIDDATAMVNKWIKEAGNSKYGSKIDDVLSSAAEKLRQASDFVTSKIDVFGEKIFGNGKFIKNTVYPKKIKWGIHEIDVRPEGKGFWGKRIKQADPRVEAFELKINPNNESYYLPHPQGGYVQYENMINSTVQDGKLILNKKSFYHVDDMPDFAKNKILQEAQRQIDSAILANYKVEWLISDKSAVEQLKKLFEKNNIKIEIKFFPE